MINRFLISALITVIQFTSIQMVCSQELLTSFDNWETLYFKDIIQRNGHTYAYYELTKHKDHRRLYELKEGEPELVYEQNASIEALEVGKNINYLYTVFQDHVELFSFESNEIKKIYFEQPLGVERLEFCLNYYVFDRGMYILPDDTLQPMTVINFRTGQHLKQTNLMKRLNLHFFNIVDSIQFYVRNYGEEEYSIISQNLFTNEIHKLATSRNGISLESFYAYAKITKGGKVYLSRGTPETTFQAYEAENGYSREYINFKDNEYTLSFYDDKYVWEKMQIKHYTVDGTLLKEHTFTSKNDSSTLYRYYHTEWISGDEMIGFTNDKGLGYFSLKKDSIYEYPLNFIDNDRFNFYTKEEDLIYIFNAKEKEHFPLSSLKFPYDISSIYKVNDSLFYFRVSEFLRSGIYTFDLRADTFYQVLDYYQGVRYPGIDDGKLQIVGEELFLTMNDTLYYYEKGGFEKAAFEIDNFYPSLRVRDESEVIEFENDLYILVRWQSSPYLFKWKGEGEFEGVIKFDRYTDGKLIQCGSKLFADLGWKGLMWLDLENKIAKAVSPHDDGTLRLLKHEDLNQHFYVKYLSTEDEVSYWLYEPILDEWYQVAAESDAFFDIYDKNYRQEYICLVNNRLISIAKGDGFYSYYLQYFDLHTKERGVCFDKGQDAVVEFLNPFQDHILFKVTIIESGGNRVEVRTTDGTSEGTSLLYSYKPNKFSRDYHFFDGRFYFNLFDTAFAKLFSYDPTTGDFDLSTAPKDYEIHQQFSLGDQIYSLADTSSYHTYYSIHHKVDSGYRKISVDQRPGNAFYRNNQSPIYSQINDTTMAFLSVFDQGSPQLWFLYENGALERKTDFVSSYTFQGKANMVYYQNDIYILIYHYPYGSQVWRYYLESGQTFLEKAMDQNMLEVYPNPANDMIQMRNLPIDMAKMAIYNSSGVNVRAQIKPRGQQQMMFSINDLPEGIYFILLEDGNSLLRGKFIKARN